MTDPLRPLETDDELWWRIVAEAEAAEAHRRSRRRTIAALTFVSLAVFAIVAVTRSAS